MELSFSLSFHPFLVFLSINLLHSDYSDACLAWVALHVLIERHGFFHHFLVYLRGVEHVQSVLVPYGYADV